MCPPRIMANEYALEFVIVLRLSALDSDSLVLP